jgi:hypothetical protein
LPAGQIANIESQGRHGPQLYRPVNGMNETQRVKLEAAIDVMLAEVTAPGSASAVAAELDAQVREQREPQTPAPPEPAPLAAAPAPQKAVHALFGLGCGAVAVALLTEAVWGLWPGMAAGGAVLAAAAPLLAWWIHRSTYSSRARR